MIAGEAKCHWVLAVLAGPVAGLAMLGLNVGIHLVSPNFFRSSDAGIWIVVLEVPVAFGTLFAGLLWIRGEAGWGKALLMVSCFVLAGPLALGSAYWAAFNSSSIQKVLPLGREFVVVGAWAVVFGAVAWGGMAALFGPCRRPVLLAIAVVLCGATTFTYGLVDGLNNVIRIPTRMFEPSPVAYPLGVGLAHGAFAAVMGWALFIRTAPTGRGMPKWGNALVLVAVVALAACNASVTPLTTKEVEQAFPFIVVGDTTKQDLATRGLGAADAEYENGRIWVIRVGQDGFGHWQVEGLLDRDKPYDLVLVFGANGVLERAGLIQAR